MKKLGAVLITLCLVLGIYSACSTAAFSANGGYRQSEARAMLNDVNAFRTGPDAWYWNQSNTQKVRPNCQKLTWDYNLEQIAMIRAKELVTNFDHIRPDGRNWDTCKVNGTSSYGENISCGDKNTAQAMESWKETGNYYDYPDEGQAHRRNMLNANYHAIGIAHYVAPSGENYWVQELGFANSGARKTAASNSLQAKNHSQAPKSTAPHNASRSVKYVVKSWSTRAEPVSHKFVVQSWSTRAEKPNRR